MKIEIKDYSFRDGFARVELFGQEVEFKFKSYDAMTAAIECGIVNQPDDRDKTRVGYESPIFSAVVREVGNYRMIWHLNTGVLTDMSGDESERVINALAGQAEEVRAVIQAEAMRLNNLLQKLI